MQQLDEASKRRILIWLLGPFLGLMVILGVALLWAGNVWRAEEAASHDWPTATATITKSEVVERRRGRQSMYEPVIEYRYEVGGQELTSNRVSFVDHFRSSQNQAKAVVDVWPVGETFPVHYDPKRPDASVLVLPEPTGWRLTDYVGVLLIFVSTLIFGFAWRGLRGSDEPKGEPAV